MNFQLAAKVTNTILRSFGGAGAATGSAGIGAAVGTAGIGTAVGTAGIGTGVGTAATVGVGAASLATAAVGLVDPIKDLLNAFGFHSVQNDQYAFEAARKAGRQMFGGQSPAQYGRQSAKDLVDNVVSGIAASGGRGGSGGNTVVNVTMKVGDREIQEIFSTAVGLHANNFLAGPGTSRVESGVSAQRVMNVEVSSDRAQATANSAEVSARTANQGVAANRAAINRLVADASNQINIRNPFD